MLLPPSYQSIWSENCRGILSLLGKFTAAPKSTIWSVKLGLMYNRIWSCVLFCDARVRTVLSSAETFLLSFFVWVVSKRLFSVQVDSEMLEKSATNCFTRQHQNIVFIHINTPSLFLFLFLYLVNSTLFTNTSSLLSFTSFYLISPSSF